MNKVHPALSSKDSVSLNTGQCNNLNVPYWGSFEHPFQREIGVGFYDPLTDIEIVDSDMLALGKKVFSNKDNVFSKTKLILCNSFFLFS